MYIKCLICLILFYFQHSECMLQPDSFDFVLLGCGSCPENTFFPAVEIKQKFSSTLASDARDNKECDYKEFTECATRVSCWSLGLCAAAACPVSTFLSRQWKSSWSLGVQNKSRCTSRHWPNDMGNRFPYWSSHDFACVTPWALHRGVTEPECAAVPGWYKWKVCTLATCNQVVNSPEAACDHVNWPEIPALECIEISLGLQLLNAAEMDTAAMHSSYLQLEAVRSSVASVNIWISIWTQFLWLD